jgi:hypothetical protein
VLFAVDELPLELTLKYLGPNHSSLRGSSAAQRGGLRYAPKEPMSLSNSEVQTLVCSPSRLRALSDDELMDALRSGCNDALAILFERYSAVVFRAARGRLRDDIEAEETVQQIFAEVFQAKDQFNPDRGSFTRWLLRYTESGSGKFSA